VDKFKDRIISEFEGHDFKFFRETIWSSSLQQTDLPRIRNFLSKNNFKNIDVSIVIPSDDKTCRMRWSMHYQASGQCTSLMQQVSIPAGSNHLKLTFCYASAESRHDGRTQTIVVANALRLIFGVPVARELIITRYFSEDEDEPNLFSDEGYASLFDTQSLNMFDGPAIEETELIKIPEEAAILVDKSFAQTYPSERFILMWLAFEAIIHSVIKKGSNGEKRQTFYRDILKSDIANDEVYRLFNVRCAMFKEGQTTDPNIENDCWSLYAALQLLIMKDCAQRRSFLSGYENSVRRQAKNAT
jgi:hypothetical protein